jgi:SAM-dependent methyltransferase
MDPSFDRYAADYESTVQQSIDFSGMDYQFFVDAKASVLKEIAARHFGPGTRPNLLDVGCGVGRLHPRLGGTFGRICGVDVSPQSIAQARRENPDIEYQVSAASRLPYSPAAFDLVLAVSVVHHIPPGERPAFLAELKRVTRAGGLVCLIEHNPLNPLTRLVVFRCPFDRDAHLLGARVARRLLAQAGLTNVRSEHFLVFPLSAAWARALERRLRKLPLGAQYLALGERP